MQEIKELNDETIQALFGFEDAESEPIERLREYYFKKKTFKRVTSDVPLRILVGHKGTGKSALFKVAMAEEKENGNLPILIKPDDIADLGKSDENFLLKIRAWKFGLTKIIGEKIFSEFGLYNDDIKSKLAKFGIKLISFVSESMNSIKEKVDLAPTQRIMIDNFLKSKKIIIYIDDLDRGWEGKKDDIQRISTLLNAVRDLANDNPGLIFKVSLRSDVFYLVRTSDESTDKIESSVVWFDWTHGEILVMLVKRILTYLDIPFKDEDLKKTPQRHLNHHLEHVFEKNFVGRGLWENAPIYKVLMSLIRKRPRDLVKLCTLAAHRANHGDSSKISTVHLTDIFEEYSQGRIQDTINEYKSELPSIEKLLFGMKPNQKQKKASESYIYTTQELNNKVSSIKERTNFKFANDRIANSKNLSIFLYKINFITARKILDDGTIQRKYFEESRYLSNSFVDFGYDWEVHPAFRWALQPDDLESIYRKLELSSDD